MDVEDADVQQTKTVKYNSRGHEEIKTDKNSESVEENDQLILQNSMLNDVLNASVQQTETVPFNSKGHGEIKTNMTSESMEEDDQLILQNAMLNDVEYASMQQAETAPSNSKGHEEIKTDKSSESMEEDDQLILQNAMLNDVEDARVQQSEETGLPDSKGHKEIKTDKSSESMEEDNQLILKNAMLNHLANNKVAHFKSQQVGEPELNFEEKRKIAKDILLRNPGQFLSRFGHFLLSDHLEYFAELNEQPDNYEVSFHLKQLRRFHCKAKNEVDVKNRRFEALKKLVKEGTYFSEKEMKQRNPLLYQQLVGQYLTRKEVEDRRNADMTDIDSWVNLLLAQIERDQMLCLRKEQEDYEDGAIEEMDTSDEEQEEDDDDDDDSNDNDYDEDEDESNDCDNENDKNMYSESEQKIEKEYGDSGFEKDKEEFSSSKSSKRKKLLPMKEKELLREEFVSNMYQSFLDGKDEDFDYSQVDLNPEYDCLAVRSQDEEEKYFDSETPEIVADEQGTVEEEDELDAYMNNLKPESTPNELAGSLSTLL